MSAARRSLTMTIPIDADLYVAGVPIYWTHQIENLAHHVDKRALEPYVRYALLQWKEHNL